MPLQENITQAFKTLTAVKPFAHEKALWDRVLGEGGGVEATGPDVENRPAFVGLQAVIEASIASGLKSGKYVGAAGVIHTPLPATPLRMKGEISEGLVIEDIANDPARLETVTRREEILQSYLKAGGTLIAAYPASAEREAIQGIVFFDETKARSPLLQEEALAIPALPPEMVGATYLVQDKEGTVEMFSIRAFQASQVAGTECQWGLWAGNLEQAKIVERFTEVTTFLEPLGVHLEHSLAHNITVRQAEASRENSALSRKS